MVQICQSVQSEFGDLDHHVTIGPLLTEEIDKRCTAGTHLEGDQSTSTLRRTLLCNRAVKGTKRQTQS